MMRTTLITIVALMYLNFFCSNSDVSVTQTGNPVKASIYYEVDTSTVRNKVKRADYQISQVKVISAKMVISEIRAKSSYDEDSLNFMSEDPVILDLSFQGEQNFLDSAMTLSGTSYERIRFRIDQLESDHGSIYSDNSDMQNKSILVRGYVDNDTSKVFEFSTDLSENLDFEFDTPIIIPDQLEFGFVMQFKVTSWFVDEDGGVLDPREDDNKSEIEGNIKNSIKVIEDD